MSLLDSCLTEVVDDVEVFLEPLMAGNDSFDPRVAALLLVLLLVDGPGLQTLSDEETSETDRAVSMRDNNF